MNYNYNYHYNLKGQYNTDEQRVCFLKSLCERTKSDLIYWEPLNLFIKSYTNNEMSLKNELFNYEQNSDLLCDQNVSFFFHHNNCHVFAICYRHKNLNTVRLTIQISNEFQYPITFADSARENNEEIIKIIYELFNIIKSRYDFWLKLDLGERGPLGTTVRRLLSE